MEVVSAALIQVSFVKGEGMLEGNLFLFLFFLKLQLFEGWWGQLKLLVSVLNSQSELD